MGWVRMGSKPTREIIDIDGVHTQYIYIYMYMCVCVLYRQWVLMQDIDLVNLTTWNDNLLLSMFFLLQAGM